MKVTILGCGGSAGVPMIGGENGEGVWGACHIDNVLNERTRSSILIETSTNKRLLIDSGPDLRTQLLRAKVGELHGVLFTHAHADHIAGLDDLRAINRQIGAPLPFYATSPVMSDLQERFAYVFKPWSGGAFYRPVTEPKIVEETDEFQFYDLTMRLFPQRHNRITTLGLRCQDFAYSTDVEFLSDEAFEVLAGVQTWIVGCFQYEPHVAHASVSRVIEWHRRLKPQRTILTHMGPDLDYDTLRHNLPSGMEPAYDGMILTL